MNSSDTQRRSRLYAAVQHVLLVLFAAIVFFAPKNYLFVSERMRTIGNVIGVVGVLLILTAVVSLRRVIQVAPEPKSNGELIQSGPYKYLRHPIYTGMLFGVLGLFLRTPTIWVGAASIGVIVFLFFKARFEETLLGIAYPAYEDYRQRTWGLFPGWRS